MEKLEIVLYKYQITLQEFQLGMTSTISQCQGYDFHETTCFSTQFFKTEN